MYKEKDIVLVKSRSASGIKPFHVRLVKKIVVKETKGSTGVWPGYIGWDAELVYPEEAEYLRKRWCIPFKFPDQIQTFIFEEEIIKKQRRKRSTRQRKRKQ
tara:strand:- start:865 stop:1167 length:303 start_codon:yes stop_codon:yes gene_type:complete